MMDINIPLNTADIWITPLDVTVPSPQLDTFAAILSADEHERLLRFKFESLKTAFLVARALCRTALANYTGLAPEALQFSRNAYGKPGLDLPAGAAPLHFNLSHSKSLVACAVSRQEIGLDVESRSRQNHNTGIAEHYFSSTEHALIQAAPVEQRQALFIQIWTLKEAYVKALGTGLSTPLNSFSVVNEAGQIQYRPEGEAPGLAAFDLTLFDPGFDHVAALACAAKPSLIDLQVVHWPTGPGQAPVATPHLHARRPAQAIETLAGTE